MMAYRVEPGSFGYGLLRIDSTINSLITAFTIGSGFRYILIIKPMSPCRHDDLIRYVGIGGQFTENFDQLITCKVPQIIQSLDLGRRRLSMEAPR